MRLNGIIGAEIPYYKMMNKAMPGPAKDTKRKPKNGRLTEIDPKTNKVSGVRMKAIIAQKSAGYTKSIKRDWQEWKRTKNRKDTYRNTPRENRRRKTERRASVETINTR